MRRKEREITNLEEIEKILSDCQECYVGMLTHDGEPYVVPLNFGYAQTAESFVFYFHSAPEGKKIMSLMANPQVFLTFVSANQVVAREPDVACTYTTKYASVMVRGTAEFVKAVPEKQIALKHLMQHQTGRMDFEFKAQMLEKVTVFKVTAKEVTAKTSI